MRAFLQRVSNASVTIDEKEYSSINDGLLILIGIKATDTSEDVSKLVSKILKLRIFNDENGLMNLSVTDVNGSILVVSQFTLYADTKKGNRPSYIHSAKPDNAIPLYEQFVAMLKNESVKEIKTGVFGADMKVSLVNDGPVTILLDSNE